MSLLPACPVPDPSTGEVNIEEASTFSQAADVAYEQATSKYATLLRTKQNLDELARQLAASVESLERELYENLCKSESKVLERMAETHERNRASKKTAEKEPEKCTERASTGRYSSTLPTIDSHFVDTPGDPDDETQRRLQVPDVLLLVGPNGSAYAGEYTRLANHDMNGYPTWRHVDGVYHLFSSNEGVLLVRDFAPCEYNEDYTGATLASVFGHDGDMPPDVGGWQVNCDGSWKEDMRVRFVEWSFPLDEQSCRERCDNSVPSVESRSLEEVRVPVGENDHVFGDNADGDDDGDTDEEPSDSDSDNSFVEDMPAQRSQTQYELPDPSLYLSSKKRRIYTAQF